MVREVITMSGFDLPAESDAAKALRVWKLAGGAYRELIQRAIEFYAKSAEYKRYVSAEEE